MATPSDTLARLRARSTEAGRFVLILDTAWNDKLTAAYEAKQRAETLNDSEGLRVAEAEIHQLEDLAGDMVQVFRFRRLSKPEYEALVAAHPLTEAQRKEEEAKAPILRRTWNDDTFAPAFLHAALIEPKLSLEEVHELLDNLLSVVEARQLVNAAVGASTLPAAAPAGLRLP